MRLSKLEGSIELFNRIYERLSLHLDPYKARANQDCNAPAHNRNSGIAR
ncbi:Hypothetical protein NGAL_HAMBI2605_65090 [Neorhizobium galegae bv. orientalis]|nr:Hypothetical protein NGAL_HAMBI2605_65090 [Neorhizobium galegae bv. orientalis]